MKQSEVGNFIPLECLSMLALHEIYVTISRLDMYLVKMNHTLLPLLP